MFGLDLVNMWLYALNYLDKTTVYIVGNYKQSDLLVKVVITSLQNHPSLM